MTREDRVIVWFTATARHIGGGFLRLRSLPVTGKRVSWEQVHRFRVADERLVEHWAVSDDYALVEATAPGTARGVQASIHLPTLSQLEAETTITGSGRGTSALRVDRCRRRTPQWQRILSVGSGAVRRLTVKLRHSVRGCSSMTAGLSCSTGSRHPVTVLGCGRRLVVASKRGNASGRFAARTGRRDRARSDRPPVEKRRCQPLSSSFVEDRLWLASAVALIA